MNRMSLFFAICVLAVTCADSEASSRRTTGSAATGAQVRRAGPSNGPLANLMELERRKNAALRQMFFGR